MINKLPQMTYTPMMFISRTNNIEETSFFFIPEFFHG
jgi:hypothetical protein